MRHVTRIMPSPLERDVYWFRLVWKLCFIISGTKIAGTYSLQYVNRSSKNHQKSSISMLCSGITLIYLTFTLCQRIVKIVSFWNVVYHFGTLHKHNMFQFEKIIIFVTEWYVASVFWQKSWKKHHFCIIMEQRHKKHTKK